MRLDSESGSPPSSPRFVYLDEKDLVSLKLGHHLPNSPNSHLECCGSSSSNASHGHLESPCCEGSHRSGREAQHPNRHPSSHRPSGGRRRKSLGKSLAKALTSPGRLARGSKVSANNRNSPKRGVGESLRQALGHNPLFFHSRRETWQEELGLPRNTTEEQAIAILLSRELDQLDL
jgi:hypothetical protein